MRRTQINFIKCCENIANELAENYNSHGHYVEIACMSTLDEIDFAPRDGFDEVIFIESANKMLIGYYKSGLISECCISDLLYT